MKDSNKRKIQELVTACRETGELGLVSCSSGNMSCRCDDGLAAMSASGSWLGRINEEAIATCRIDSGEVVGELKPTVEAGFHLGILKSQPNVNVVLHFQSPFATAIACCEKIERNFNCIIEVPVYIGEPAVVDFYMPGSDALAAAVIEAMKTHQMVILRNHGQVTVGRDFDEAIQRAVFFELACKILTLQKDCKPLSVEAVEQLAKLNKA
ncbi:MAG: class II aldolase/adducin family protein [Anaerohalosphaeraceae bacterium]|nr:class II aldolase/adducin family protein [Anaerohalosphaeraceae bacterium]